MKSEVEAKIFFRKMVTCKTNQCTFMFMMKRKGMRHLYF